MSVMFLMPTQEFGGTMMTKVSLKLVILPKGVYIRETHKCFYVRINKFIICGLYQNKPSEKIQLFFQEFTHMSKTKHTKKVIKDMNVFRKYFRVRQGGSDEIKTSISFIKDELQNPIGKKISVKRKGKIILVEWGWTRKCSL